MKSSVVIAIHSFRCSSLLSPPEGPITLLFAIVNTVVGLKWLVLLSLATVLLAMINLGLLLTHVQKQNIFPVSLRYFITESSVCDSFSSETFELSSAQCLILCFMNQVKKCSVVENEIGVTGIKHGWRKIIHLKAFRELSFIFSKVLWLNCQTNYFNHDCTLSILTIKSLEVESSRPFVRSVTDILQLINTNTSSFCRFKCLFEKKFDVY